MELRGSFIGKFGQANNGNNRIPNRQPPVIDRYDNRIGKSATPTSGIPVKSKSASLHSENIRHANDRGADASLDAPQDV